MVAVLLLTRRFWLLLHRYAGLVMALFLVLAGVTGSVIAFYQEIDRGLNPRLFRVTPSSQALPILELRKLAEILVPQARVDSVDLHRRPDEAIVFYLQPRIDPITGAPYLLEFDQLFLDPYNGQTLGVRRTDEGLLPFIYLLHHSLALPEPWGRWLFGFIALVWTVDCFVGFYLTLPAGRMTMLKRDPKKPSFWRSWRRAWLVKPIGSLYRLNFDVHRATSLWTWGMLLVLAISSVQFNLYDEVFTPALEIFLPVVDMPNSLARLPGPLDEPKLTWEQALEHGRALAAMHSTLSGFHIEREDSLRIDRDRGVFIYSVKSSLDIRSDIADTRVFFSALDGRELGFTYPSVAGGNAFSQWLSALHTGRVWGIPYRIFLSLMGLIVATLSVSGIVIWWSKRRARARVTKTRLRRKAPDSSMTPSSFS
jgi:uncharacterized iron-regulated membrane protein